MVIKGVWNPWCLADPCLRNIMCKYFLKWKDTVKPYFWIAISDLIVLLLSAWSWVCETESSLRSKPVTNSLRRTDNQKHDGLCTYSSSFTSFHLVKSIFSLPIIQPSDFLKSKILFFYIHAIQRSSVKWQKTVDLWINL